MTTGATSSYGPLIGQDTSYPSYYRSKTWAGTDRSQTGGLLVDHPYECTWQDEDRGAALLRVGWEDKLYTLRYFAGVPPDVRTFELTDNDTLKLLSKLSEKIRGHDFNAGVFVGTAHQTWRLVAENANKLASGLIALKRGSSKRKIFEALGYGKKKARRLARTGESKTTVQFLRKDLSGRWLEVSYGWIPLVQDVYSAGEAMARESLASEVKFKATVQRVESGSSYNANCIWTHTRLRRKTVIYYLETSSITGRLGLTDPKTVLWELLPWSFVIDWFIPVGSFLENRAFFASITGRSCTTVVEKDWKTMSSTHGVCAYCWRTVRPIRHDTGHMIRSVSNGQLDVPLPSFKSPLSSDWRRAANAIALLAGLR